MPKPQRRFHTNSKKHKKVPETADDFLSAGIEYEESGDRWRPGDKLKAGRFYLRAIESYTASLLRAPSSFDATYNRARLLYALSQTPSLLPESSPTLSLEYLTQSLEGHRAALSLQPNDDDALFNTAQVLTSLAEAVLEGIGKDGAEERRRVAREWLLEAISTFEKCFAIQKENYETFGEMEAEADREAASSGRSAPSHQQQDAMVLDSDDDDETGGVSLPVTAKEVGESGESQGEYAHIHTPTTPGTLLDTLLALLGSHTTLLPLLPAEELPNHLAALAPHLSTTLPNLQALLPERIPEIRLTTALLRCAESEAHFRCSPDASTLAAWSATILDPSIWPEDTVETLSAKSDLHISISQAAVDPEVIPSPHPLVAWKHLSHASLCLGAASKLDPTNPNLYLARGDVEVMRSRIQGVEAVEKARGVLRKNAGVYYRGAGKVAGEMGEIGKEVEVKGRMVEAEERGDGEVRWTGLGARLVSRVVQEAVEEGVFGEEWRGRVPGVGVETGAVEDVAMEG